MPLQDVTIEIAIAKAAGLIGFGKPLIVGQKLGGASYKNYSDLEELTADGFDDTTAVYQKAQALLAQEGKPSIFAVAAYDAEAGETAADLVRELADQDWYFLITTATEAAEIEAVADVVEGLQKVYSAQVTGLTGLQTFNSKKYDRTFVAVHPVEDEHIDAANVGENGNKDVGSITWKFKTLSGITPQKLGTAELQDIHNAGGYAYVTKAGKNQTSEGTLVSGEYIDVQHGKDWIQSNGENAIQQALQNNPKLPFTNAGISTLEAAMTNVLRQGYTQGIIADDADGQADYTLNFPTMDQVSAADRAQRTYTGATFEFTLAGAIHQARVKGTINV